MLIFSINRLHKDKTNKSSLPLIRYDGVTYSIPQLVPFFPRLSSRNRMAH